MTCIARPSVDGIYWATNTSVERRVCEVDARRRMSGASKTTEATWNDEKSSIIMLASSVAPPKPPKPPKPPEPPEPLSPRAKFPGYRFGLNPPPLGPQA